MRLLFTNLTMLAGLGALAVPILIHLLLKRRKQWLRFSTLQFFVQQDEQSSQRRRLRNLLLLAVRLLLLTLLVFAFARPYLPGGQGSDLREQKRLAVFILDRTASMQASGTSGLRWAQAAEAVQKLLGGLRQDDLAALVSCSSHSEVLSGAAPPEAIGLLMKDLKPTFGNGNLGEALDLARKIVTSSGADRLATIYVVSDMQAMTCANLGAHPLPHELEVRSIPAGDLVSANLAVTALQLDGRNGETPHALIARFAEEEFKSVKLKLVVDDKEVLSRPLALGTGTVTRVDLALPPMAPGWHSGLAQIEANDALPLDNTRFDAFYVPEPVKCLAVETRPGKRSFEEETFFLVSALDPMRGSSNNLFSRFAIEKLLPGELSGKLSARASQAAPDLVILPGLKQIPPGLGRELSRFVQAGGGLLMFLGDDVSASAYQAEFGDLMPLQIGHLERNASDTPDAKWHLDEYDPASPIFSIFRPANSGNLAIPEFTCRFSVVDQPSRRPVEAEDSSAIGLRSPKTNRFVLEIPARFTDGVPAMALRTVGRGRVMLVNSSADTSWTDWPKHKTFVPWLHRTCYHLSSRSGTDQTRVAPHLVASDDADVPLGATARRQTFRVVLSGKSETLATADDTGRLRVGEFSQPGAYLIRDQQGREFQRAVVNLPADESDLMAFTPAEFQRQLSRVQEPPPNTLAAGLLGGKNSQKELWRFILLAVLALLFAEVFLANRTFA